MAIDPNEQLPGGPKSFNEDFFDAMIRHQIGLMNLSGKLRNDMNVILDKTETSMRIEINGRLFGHIGLNTPADVRRLQLLKEALAAIRNPAWKDANKLMVRKIEELARSEPGFVTGLFKTVMPVEIDLLAPSAELLTALATSYPFQGKNLKEWLRNVQAADLRRISDAVTNGMAQGLSSRAIAASVVGTQAQAGRNGATQLTRNNIQALTRTAVNAIATQARRALYQRNPTIFDKELFTATLDSRTSAICQSLDGKILSINKGPWPPLHINCRSMRVAIITPEAIGRRPVRTFSERGLVRDYAKANNIKTIPKSRANLPFGTKGDFDQWARGEMRRRTGTVPAKITYQEWLTKQPAMFQNDVLGETRAKLFRKGDLSLDKFVDRNTTKEISLNTLAQTERAAFEAAGLDPEDFL